jgi:hypothetical protein
VLTPARSAIFAEGCAFHAVFGDHLSDSAQDLRPSPFFTLFHVCPSKPFPYPEKELALPATVSPTISLERSIGILCKV